MLTQSVDSVEKRNGNQSLNLIAAILTAAAIVIAMHNILFKTASVLKFNFALLPSWTQGYPAILVLSGVGLIIWHISARYATIGTKPEFYISAGMSITLLTFFGTIAILMGGWDLN